MRPIAAPYSMQYAEKRIEELEDLLEEVVNSGVTYRGTHLIELQISKSLMNCMKWKLKEGKEQT